MTPLRAKYIGDLVIRGRSKNTQEAYTRYVCDLARYYRRSPELISYEQVTGWLYHLIKERQLSASSVNIAVSAVRFLYGVTLGRETLDLMASVSDMKRATGRADSEVEAILTPPRQSCGRPVTPLRAKYIRDLVIRGRSKNTQEAYIRYVRDLACYYRSSPELISYEEVTDWLYHLIKERQLSASSVNIAVSAVRFLYAVTLGRETLDLMASVPHMKRATPRAEVYARSEVEAILIAPRQPRDRVLLMTVYGCGLRISEATQLKTSDIDRARMQLRVRDGKGAKGRVLPLSVGKERCATQGRHPSFEAFVCNSPHGKRRRTTSSAALAGPFEHKNYGALSPCDGTQASRGALTFGSDQQRLHRTVSAHTGLTLANPLPSGLTWRRSVHRCRAAARLSATNLPWAASCALFYPFCSICSSWAPTSYGCSGSLLPVVHRHWGPIFSIVHTASTGTGPRAPAATGIVRAAWPPKAGNG